jgi:hypothetical protein
LLVHNRNVGLKDLTVIDLCHGSYRAVAGETFAPPNGFSAKAA